MSDHRALTFSRLGLALALAYCGGAQAQSLQEVYDAARAYDATYLSARALSETAQYRLQQAEALGRPTVGVGATGQYQSTSIPPGESSIGVDPNTGDSIPLPVNRLNTTTLTAGLNGRMAIYNPGNTATIEQARRALGVFAADLETAEQDLIVRVAQAYFDVLAAQDTLSTSRANKTAIAEQLASAKRNFEVGTATITDTREAQARYDLAISQDIGADNDLRTKQVVLDQLVGRPGVTPKPLIQPVALPALPTDDIDSWVAQGEQSPPVRKARLGLDIAHLDVDKARAGGKLSVDMTGSLGVQNVRNNLPGELASATGAGTTRAATLGVQINYPLYTGGAVQGAVYEKLKLEEKAGTDLEFARRSVSQNTRSAFLGVQSLRAQVKALEAAESSSKLSLEATQLGYKVGVRVNIDVLNAQTQLYTTEAQLAKARYDVLVNGLKLRQANGTLRPDDVSAVNVLLAK
ncbi:MAG TPA: TolC family outer membrane protein [Burkholderiaceae bacterium]|jgi:outer membrane protein